MCRINKYELVCERVAGYNAEFIDKKMRDSGDVARFIIEILKSDRFPVEHFMVFMLDTKLKILGFSDVAKGNVDSAPIHPREVFQPALMTAKCAAIIAAHNHPSGDPTPSSEDIAVTKRLIEAGEILGIKIIDHIVVGYGCWTSLREEGYIA